MTSCLRVALFVSILYASFVIINAILHRGALRTPPHLPTHSPTFEPRKHDKIYRIVEQADNDVGESASQRMSLASLPGADVGVGVADEHFTCENVSFLRIEGDAPIARGLNKEVWKAVWPDLNKTYAVKRRRLDRANTAADLKRKKAYTLEQLAREHTLFKQFTHRNILTGYGGCVDASADDSSIALVTEFVESYTIAELLQQALPWCVWTKIAIDFAMLIKYLHEADDGPFVHCDWKLDQFIVRKQDYRLILVDVDALTLYPRGSAYLRNETCETSQPNTCAQIGAECFQAEARGWDVPDAACDPETETCIGFDTKSMVWSFARGALVEFIGAPLEMFRNRNGPSPEAVRGSAMYKSTLADVVRNSTRVDKSVRWDVYAMLSSLRTLWSQANGKECLTRWNWHKRFL